MLPKGRPTPRSTLCTTGTPSLVETEISATLSHVVPRQPKNPSHHHDAAESARAVAVCPTTELLRPIFTQFANACLSEQRHPLLGTVLAAAEKPGCIFPSDEAFVREKCVSARGLNRSPLADPGQARIVLQRSRRGLVAGISR